MKLSSQQCDNAPEVQIENKMTSLGNIRQRKLKKVITSTRLKNNRLFQILVFNTSLLLFQAECNITFGLKNITKTTLTINLITIPRISHIN